MTRLPTSAPVARLRPPHAIGLLFVANGLALPALLPRFPQVKDAVGADVGAFGLALLGTGVGGILGSALAPLAVRRLGARAAAVTSAVLLAGLTVLVGLAGSVVALFAALGLMGVSDGVADMTQNHLMFEVQRTTVRSLASRMHALWSVGALLGAAGGTLAAARGMSVVGQSVVLAGVACALVAVAGRVLWRWRPGAEAALPVSEPAPPAVPAAPVVAPGSRRWRSRWGRLVAAAVAVAAVEGVASEWSALTLRDGLGATVAMAGVGPTAFAGAMLAGRLAGDRAIDRLGMATAARGGAGLVAVGSGVGLLGAVLLHEPILLVLGLVAAGVGSAILFPSMLAAGARLDGTGTGVAVASSAARVGFLVVPLVVGTVADAVGLPPAFSLLPLAGAVVAFLLPSALSRGRVT